MPGDFYTEGPTTAKKIALTFDDGPGPNTQQFLDLLDRYQVKATFFMLSNQVKLRPAVAKAVVERGHEIANHTTQHMNYKARLKKVRATAPEGAVERVKAELVKDMEFSRVIIEKTTGRKLKILRMPHGIDGPWVREAAKQAGFIVVNWTYGSDWASSPIVQQVPGYIRAIRPGAIILLHDGWPKSQKSLEITEAVIKAAKEKGYEMVTVGELLGI